MIKLLITDLDDTLYPWLDSFVPAFYAMVEETGHVLGIPPEQLLEEYRIIHQQLGDVESPNATFELPSVRVHLAGLSAGQMREHLASAFDEFDRVRAEHLNLHHDVAAVLRGLTGMGIRIVGCTEAAGENGLKKLRTLNADNFFTTVYVAAGKYDKARPKAPDEKTVLLDLRKPDPHILQHILLDQRVLPEDALYLGDSFTKDVCMANACGVSCVQLRHPKNQQTAARMFRQLHAVSSWSPEEYAYEQELRSACVAAGLEPASVVTAFSDIIPLVMREQSV